VLWWQIKQESIERESVCGERRKKTMENESVKQSGESWEIRAKTREHTAESIDKKSL